MVKIMSRVGRDYLQVGFYTEVFFGKRVTVLLLPMVLTAATTTPAVNSPLFLNIMNEWYLRDCSRKITAVLRAKGKEGKPITSNPPYGFCERYGG